MTVAMSLLIHGEAVRFNRGQSRGDDFDFKYMRGRDGSVFPYVSSQCYKRYWRESLRSPFSPITKEPGKNQAYTDGDPITYVDDDLFGYMIAGATETDDESGDTGQGTEDTRRVFEGESLRNAEALKTRLLDGSALSKFILSKVPTAEENFRDSATSLEDTSEILLNVLDEAARDPRLAEVAGSKSTRRKPKPEEIAGMNTKILLRMFSKELQEKPKRPTTRRTAPVRMHALVGFSGIKTAKDFQTFSRDVPYTGKYSIVNPAGPGIYSGWLKARILIESHRIGKFYVGENMDISEKEAAGRQVLKEQNPYSRKGESVEYVQLDDPERLRRLRAALQALADIGNKQGPASGALHDGSLRPKAFVAGLMTCADSPFDYIWRGRNEASTPELDINLLRDSINDWEDLFASKKIYIGLPVDAGRQYRAAATASQEGSIVAAPEAPAPEMKEALVNELKEIGFEAVVDTPRKALVRLAQEATL